MPNLGDLRICHINNIIGTNYIPVNSPEEAMELLDELTTADLQNKNVTDNTFGLEVYDVIDDAGEWLDWDNDFGQNIFEAQESKKIREQHMRVVYECPDCLDPIPETVADGDSCSNCGHVFNC